MRERTPREEAIAIYIASLRTGKPLPPPLGLTEKEFVRGMARQLGITEAWFRRRYLKEAREGRRSKAKPLTGG